MTIMTKQKQIFLIVDTYILYSCVCLGKKRKKKSNRKTKNVVNVYMDIGRSTIIVVVYTVYVLQVWWIFYI